MTRQKTSKGEEDLNNALNQVNLMDVYAALPAKMVKVHTEHLPRQTIFWDIKQISIMLKGFKSYKVCSLITIELNQKSIMKDT